MKKIDVSTPTYPNTFTSVDDKDCLELTKHKWTVDRVGTNFYLTRQKKIKGQWKKVRMHREILGISSSDVCVDHINGDTLDNTRRNLRPCSDKENKINTKISKRNKSGFKGVSWSKRDERWRVQICYNGKRTSLGTFFCIKKAAESYDKAASSLFGEFANINFKKAKVKK